MSGPDVDPTARSGFAPRRQRSVPAVYMRGGTSKGVFFHDRDLPPPGEARDRLLLRVMGSPDPYGKQTDGMGGATSSTSKVVVVAKSTRPDCDVDYWFGAVSIDAAVIDWTGNCGNLTAAVAPFAIEAGLVPAPAGNRAVVRLWQAGTAKRIIATVPISDGQIVEEGDFRLDGVAFPAPEIGLEFQDPAAGGGAEALFPTGRTLQVLEVPWVGTVAVTLINAGNPTIFVAAEALGLKGTEMQKEVNNNQALLMWVEELRAQAAVAMGLAATTAEATLRRPHTPKVMYVAKAQSYRAADGRQVSADSVDLLVRTFSMGVLHHAIPGTGAVAVAAAAAIPGTVVSRIVSAGRDGRVRLGHPSGILEVGAEVSADENHWAVSWVRLSRSARRLMEGRVYIPSSV
jgi:probable AcnD-accessory protein PrpF